jgi:membrane associated rhomboid family serine protease
MRIDAWMPGVPVKASSMQCPRCHWTIEGAREDRAPEIIPCHRCDGKFLLPKELAEDFGDKATPQKWVEEKFATTKVRKSAIRCPIDRGHMNAYTLVLSKRALTLRYCDDCEGIWLDSVDSLTLGNLLQLRAKALKNANAQNPENSGYLFQLFSRFPMGMYFPKRTTPLVIFTVLFFIGASLLTSLIGPRLHVASETWMLIPPSFFLGEQPWAILSHMVVPDGLFQTLIALVFLFVFGVEIEDRCGGRGLILVLLFSILGSSLLYLLVSGETSPPYGGAAGAIFGLLGAYRSVFPGTRVWIKVFRNQVVFPFWALVLFWCVLQIAFALSDSGGTRWYTDWTGYIVGASIGYVMRRTWIGRNRFRY